MSKLLEKLSNKVTIQITIFIIFVYVVQLIVNAYFFFNGGEKAAEEITTFLFTLNLENFIYIFPFITSIFSHGSLLHLFANTIAFISFGLVAEYYFKSNKKYFMFFILTALLASLSQLLVFYITGNETGLLGSSGAIAAIIGFVSIKKPDLKAFFIVIPMRLRNLVLVFVSISVGLLIYGGFGTFNIAHVAHLSGLFAGLIYGYYFNEIPESNIPTIMRVKSYEEDSVSLILSPKDDYNVVSDNKTVSSFYTPLSKVVEIEGLSENELVRIKNRKGQDKLYSHTTGEIIDMHEELKDAF